jgi:hypothetical protein
MFQIDPIKNSKYSNVFITCLDFSKRFQILDKLDEGYTANVFKIINKKSNQKFALKAFNHRNIQSTI